MYTQQGVTSPAATTSISSSGGGYPQYSELQFMDAGQQLMPAVRRPTAYSLASVAAIQHQLQQQQQIQQQQQQLGDVSNAILNSIQQQQQQQ
jgi:hypothetical protein